MKSTTKKYIGFILLAIVVYVFLFSFFIEPLFFWEYPRLILFLYLVGLLSSFPFFVGLFYLGYCYSSIKFSLNIKNLLWVLVILITLAFNFFSVVNVLQDIFSYNPLLFEGVYESSGFLTKNIHQRVTLSGQDFYVPMYNHGIDELSSKYKILFLPHTKIIVDYERIDSGKKDNFEKDG